MATRLASLLRPSTIAVLGASRDPHKWGQRVIRYTREAGFTGEVYAVNPHAQPGSIPGATVVPTIGAAAGPVGCAFLALPRDLSVAAVQECRTAGVDTVVVAASGFGESSADGAALETELAALADANGPRLVGPNCFGVYSSVGGVNLTPFAYVPPGRVALVSQSGNVSAQLFLAAARAGLGFSHCVGIGNQLDVGFGDLLSELATDPDTDAITLYVEGLPPGGGAAFLAGLADCRAAGKPVVVIKAGVAPLAAAVAQTHTRSLAADDQVWDAVLDDGGAIRVAAVPEMVDVLQCLRVRPRLGPRVAVITDGGGDSVMSVDALSEANNLTAARLSDEVVAALVDVVPPAAPRVAGCNPLTLDTAGGVEDDPEVLARCIEIVGAGDGADVLLVGGLFGTYVDQRAAEIRAAERIRAVHERTGAAIVFQSPVPPAESAPLALLAAAGIPFFASAQLAVQALDRVVARLGSDAPTDARDAGAPTRVLLDEATAGTLAAGGRTGSGRLWPVDEAARLLREHGVATPTIEVVTAPSELLASAERVGYPVCLKTADPQVVHKSDVGGVFVGLTDAEALHRAAAVLWSPEHRPPLLVMPSFPAAFEVLVGGFYDPTFGPVVLLGRGGVLAEVEADTQIVAGRVTRAAVSAALGRLRCAPVLRGYRSSPALDVAALVDLAVALCSVLESTPDVAVDLNPVLLYADGYQVADIRVLGTVSG